MILVAPERAFAVLMSLLLIFGGQVMAASDSHDPVSGHHAMADGLDAGQDGEGLSELPTDCGADHCSAALFPRINLAEAVATVRLQGLQVNPLPPPAQSFFKPPRASV